MSFRIHLHLIERNTSASRYMSSFYTFSWFWFNTIEPKRKYKYDTKLHKESVTVSTHNFWISQRQFIVAMSVLQILVK